MKFRSEEIIKNMLNYVTQKSRIHYIDVMKGVLIIMVMIGHLGALGNFSDIELKASPYIIRDWVACNLIAPYFMAAFFLVTGYCTNFNKPMRLQIYMDFRRLIVPTIFLNTVMNLIIGVVSGNLKIRDFIVLPWFIVALFIGKIIVRAIIDGFKSSAWRFCILFFFAFVGCYIWKLTWWLNLSSLPHALAFSFFIFLGYEFRRSNIKPSKLGGAISVVVFIALLLMFNLWLKRDLPALCALITFPWYWFPIYIATAISGSYMVYAICYHIWQNRFIEYLGRNSLIIYITHSASYFLFARLVSIMGIDVNYNWAISIMVMAMMIMTGILWGWIWIKLTSMHYTKWIMGK